MNLDSYSFSFSPSVDAINQFRVATNSYPAEIGGAPGGQVNLTTKSGTNTFHGTAWEFNRSDAFEAFNAFQPRTSGAKPPRLNRNQFGANLGGPVWIPKLYNGKDRTFFFFNWESGRQISGTYGGHSAARWFNTAAFTSPTPGSFGNSARMEIHVPGLEDVDASATKSFRFLESQQVMFRAEFFNALNHVNLGPPGTSVLNTAAFGRITTAGDPRVVQFGLKYSF